MHADLSVFEDNVLAGWFDVDYTNPPDQILNIGYSISVNGESWPLPEYIYDDEFEGPFIVTTEVYNNYIFATYHARWSDSTGYNPIIFI